ncbi:hypothetical protein BDQ17DRAFT_1339215 [Cyathus striatus]|nr:hypothetical protein BDQ17DRAFT_1339215 [Cyathus striatus]
MLTDHDATKALQDLAGATPLSPNAKHEMALSDDNPSLMPTHAPPLPLPKQSFVKEMGQWNGNDVTMEWDDVTMESDVVMMKQDSVTMDWNYVMKDHDNGMMEQRNVTIE